ncbi:dynactin subunit [Ophiocordyceps camponoti-floridani]|uniref:Dynactin subunit 4 n=1 Tax=Ophiocordyceps camponoti-floridani TaxID=2030778 RepID=A0A8H4Q0F3_9HYPO|nr:dynactin subunit [Ophiocordyceps camponoti-floridani]
MSRPVPYTLIQCPCSDPSATVPASASSASSDAASSPQSPDGHRTFDPRAPRSSFSLYPLEYLLYCEDCQQIRCPRCVTDEIVTYFCPSCLFEVPSSNLRSEGNRCTRSCFQCPVCVAPLQASSIRPSALNVEGDGLPTGPYALFCLYCSWSSREAGIEFERPSGIHSQIAKMEMTSSSRLTSPRDPGREDVADTDTQVLLPGTRHLHFSSLKAFYHEQLADARAAAAGGLQLRDGLALASSPGSLTRIMSLYTGRATQQPRSPHGQPADTVREALTSEEGLRLAQLDESRSIERLANAGWHATSSLQQRLVQPQARFDTDLRPVASLLRTKRSKRCPVCRHIISKPEAKVTSTRFKIRLVAKSYMPSITIRPLTPITAPVPVGSRPATAIEPPLSPLRPHQFILTFRNPLFDAVSVTLATPSLTPGRVTSRVTILCPQFDVGANTDIPPPPPPLTFLPRDLTAPSRRPNADEPTANQAEAGKVWDRGRNWTSIVLELIPASLRASASRDAPLGPGDALVEIPMFVRVEWEADAQHDMGGPVADRDKEARERRELAYWCVVGVGRIAED